MNQMARMKKIERITRRLFELSYEADAVKQKWTIMEWMQWMEWIK